MNNKFKPLLGIIIILVYLILFLWSIIKCNIVYVLPLIFEVFILLLSGFKYKNNKKVKLEKIIVIKNIVLLITLIIGVVSINIYINQIVLKILLTLTIILQVATLLTINNFFNGKKCKRSKRV